MTGPSHSSKRKLSLRVLAWCAASAAAVLLVLVAALERIAHRPSPVHTTVTAAEIAAEDARLQQMGLVLRDGSFLKQHPFQPPWTSHSLLVPSTWSEPFIKTLLGSSRVRSDKLLADLDVLEPVMERAYGGWDSAAARGWSWTRWFADWRRQLAEQGGAELSLDQAFAPMDRLLAFQRDNHTQIPLNRWWTSDGSQTAILASPPAAACTQIRAAGGLFSIYAGDAGQQVRTARLWKSGAKSLTQTSYISMPRSYGAPQALRCGADWIPLQPAERRGRLSSTLRNVWAATLGRDRPRIERIGDGVVYARLPAFDSSHYNGVSRAGWALRAPGDRVLIVDLRDNGGGAAGYGLDVLKGWIDEGRMVPFASIGSRIVSSCLYSALKWNYPDSTGMQWKQQLLDRMAQPYPPGCPRTVASTPSTWTYLQHRFAPGPGDLRIVALVNRGCASDCEWMAEELASLPETVVAGSNTYGVCQMIQPGYSVLPHTGLPYRIALGRSNPYGDDRSVDGYGLDVDVVLPEVDTIGPAQMRELADAVARP